MEKPGPNDLQSALVKHYGLEYVGDASWDQLKAALRTRIRELLDDDFSQLVNAMYRLDVPEDRFNAALSAGHQGDVAAMLTEIVLERELKRLETRFKYKDL